MADINEGDLVRFSYHCAPRYGVVGGDMSMYSREYKAMRQILPIKKNEMEVDCKYDDERGYYEEYDDGLSYVIHGFDYGAHCLDDLELVTDVDGEIEIVKQIIAKISITLDNLLEYKRFKGKSGPENGKR